MNSSTDSRMHELVKHGTVDFPIAIYGDSYRDCHDRFYYMHYHDELELIYSYNGGIEVIVNENTYTLKEGEYLLINSNQLHNISHASYPDSRVMAIVFNKSLIALPSYSYISTNIIDSILNKGFEAIKIDGINYNVDFRKYRHDNKETRLDLVIDILKLFSYIYKSYDELKPLEASSKNNERIRDSLHYISQNYNSSITLEDIARVCNLSEGEASRLFKKIVGKSPIDYLINYRINIASSLLQKTNKSITDIAIETGFSSSNYFTIAFKKLTGTTPKEYRKKELQNH